MCEHDIDVFHPESCKGVVESFDQMLSRKTFAVQVESVRTEENLGGDNEIRSGRRARYITDNRAGIEYRQGQSHVSSSADKMASFLKRMRHQPKSLSEEHQVDRNTHRCQPISLTTLPHSTSQFPAA